LLRILAAVDPEASTWSDLGTLSVYAVQFRYDADPTPLGLNRLAYNQRSGELLQHVDEILQRPT
jgi:hypothetical protein